MARFPSNLQSLDDAVSSLGARASRRTLGFSSNSSLDDSATPQPEAGSGLDETRPAHPAGIILTRPGYFTIPSLKQLATMIGPDGRCVVDGFTVAREGYGNVYFPGRTDVTGLNLDEIVHFRRKEITIYPEDDDKPPVGEGLNKKAQVTLDCVWPNDKTTHEAVKDPEKLKVLGYQEKLERVTARIGGKFLDYRPDTGSWVFEVKHFSKYGLDDSDNEVDEAAIQASLQQQQQQQQQPLPPPIEKSVAKPIEPPGDKLQQQATGSASTGFLSRYESSAAYGSEDDEMEDLDRVFPGNSDVADTDVLGMNFESTLPTTQQLAEALGVSTEKVQGMKASFFSPEAKDVEEEDFELAFSHPRLKRALVSSSAYQPPPASLTRTPTFRAENVRTPLPIRPEGVL